MITTNVEGNEYDVFQDNIPTSVWREWGKITKCFNQHSWSPD